MHENPKMMSGAIGL